MRRWLAIFLLILLPAQYSWAAVAVYCAHEQGKSVRHAGHHQHAHKATGHAAGEASQASHESGKTPGGADNDCSTCHLGAAQSLLPQSPMVAVCAPRTAYTYAVTFDSHVPPGLDRPDWRRA
jgi:hypothetical protein